MSADKKNSDQSILGKALYVYKKEGFKSLLLRARDFVAYDLWKPVRTQIMGLGDRYKIVGPDTIYKSEYYAKRRKDPWRSEANQIGEVLGSHFEPKSVIDFGCAIGAHLEPFNESGITVQGIEGNEKAIEQAVIPKGLITKHDLREPYEPSKKYDLAISIEVAEHIPSEFDDIYVNTICNSAKRVVITAAPPGQGGTHHINEQPKEYWVKKFDSQGFSLDQKTTEQLANKFEVSNSTWVEENLLVFEEREQ